MTGFWRENGLLDASHTITNRETLKLQLDEIRRLRVAFYREEMVVGVTLGIPIFDFESKAVAPVNSSIRSPWLRSRKKKGNNLRFIQTSAGRANEI